MTGSGGGSLGSGGDADRFGLSETKWVDATTPLGASR